MYYRGSPCCCYEPLGRGVFHVGLIPILLGIENMVSKDAAISHEREMEAAEFFVVIARSVLVLSSTRKGSDLYPCYGVPVIYFHHWIYVLHQGHGNEKNTSCFITYNRITFFSNSC